MYCTLLSWSGIWVNCRNEARLPHSIKTSVHFAMTNLNRTQLSQLFSFPSTAPNSPYHNEAPTHHPLAITASIPHPHSRQPLHLHLLPANPTRPLLHQSPPQCQPPTTSAIKLHPPPLAAPDLALGTRRAALPPGRHNRQHRAVDAIHAAHERVLRRFPQCAGPHPE